MSCKVDPKVNNTKFLKGCPNWWVVSRTAVSDVANCCISPGRVLSERWASRPGSWARVYSGSTGVAVLGWCKAWRKRGHRGQAINTFNTLSMHLLVHSTWLDMKTKTRSALFCTYLIVRHFIGSSIAMVINTRRHETSKKHRFFKMSSWLVNNSTAYGGNEETKWRPVCFFVDYYSFEPDKTWQKIVGLLVVAGVPLSSENKNHRKRIDVSKFMRLYSLVLSRH